MNKRFWAYKENDQWFCSEYQTTTEQPPILISTTGLIELLDMNKDTYENTTNHKILIQFSVDTPGGFNIYYLRWQGFNNNNGSTYTLNNTTTIDLQTELIPYSNQISPNDEFWRPGHIYIKFILPEAY